MSPRVTVHTRGGRSYTTMTDERGKDALISKFQAHHDGKSREGTIGLGNREAGVEVHVALDAVEAIEVQPDE